MKAIAAPEKLYLLPKGLISYCRNTDEDVEYTRTDAFIEKVCEWLESNLCYYDENYRGIDSGNSFIEDFKNYMIGE